MVTSYSRAGVTPRYGIPAVSAFTPLQSFIARPDVGRFTALPTHDHKTRSPQSRNCHFLSTQFDLPTPFRAPYVSPVSDLTEIPVPPKKKRRLRVGYKNSMFQALSIQRVIFGRISLDKCPDKQLAELANAWDVIEERKRILRNKPLPGSLKPEAPKRKVGRPSLIDLVHHNPEPEAKPESGAPNAS